MKNFRKKNTNKLNTLQTFCANLETERPCNVDKTINECCSKEEGEDIYTNDSKKMKLSKFIHDTPSIRFSTNKDSEESLKLLKSSMKTSTPNTRLTSKSSVDIKKSVENVFDNNSNNQNIKKYFFVAKNTEFPRKFNDQHTIEKEVNSKKSAWSSNKKKFTDCESESSPNSPINFGGRKISGKYNNTEERHTTLETKLSENKNTIFNIVSYLEKKSITSKVETKISFEEFADKVLQVINDKTQSECVQKSKIPNNALAQSPNLTVDKIIDNLKANKEKCNQNSSQISNKENKTSESINDIVIMLKMNRENHLKKSLGSLTKYEEHLLTPSVGIKVKSRGEKTLDNFDVTTQNMSGSLIELTNTNEVAKSNTHFDNIANLTNNNLSKPLFSNKIYLADILEKTASFEKIVVNETCTEKTKDCTQPIRTETQINPNCKTTRAPSALLDDALLKSILTKNYESLKRKGMKQSTSNLNDVVTKLTQDTQVEAKCNKCHIKRFKKGNVKIYRLKKLKKTPLLKKPSSESTLDFGELFQKITQDFVTPKSNHSESESLSTPSSYISDDARSETLSTGSDNLNSPDRRLRQGFNELSKDQNLLYCDSQYEETIRYSKNDIKRKIQNILLRVFDDLTNGRCSTLTYRRQSYGNCELKNDRLQFKPDELVVMSEINSGFKRSEAKFKLIIYILKKIQTLLETDTKLTKRELYYQFKNIITNQSVTDRAINVISSLLDVGMWSLNVVAQKGLVFGNLRILMSSGETLNCNIPGTLIPQDVGEISEIQSTAYFILVVEKEAIFHRLIEEDLPNKLTRPFILITGKGFPDLNTQLFLKKLWAIMSIPVFILVDADPHGINIMLNYRFGSVGNAHVSHHLAVPRAKWLGVYPSEIVNFNIKRQPMTEKDLKLVEQLLKTPYMDGYPRIAQELKVLKERKYKACIEGVIRSEIFLSQVYLPTKFFAHNFI